MMASLKAADPGPVPGQRARKGARGQEEPRRQSQGGTEGGKSDEGEGTSDASAQVKAEALTLILAQKPDRSLAERALEACEAKSDPAEWAEDAFVWLASQDDVQMEQDQLAQAMQQSLEESEQRKASTKPLEECEDKELRERFEASSLLPKLTKMMGSCPLAEKGLRESLLPLLELERRALRWYTNGGTRLYFDQLSELCAQSAGKTPSLQPPNNKRKGRQKAPARNTRRKVSTTRSVTPDVASAELSDRVQVLAQIFSSEVKTLEAAIFRMPEQGGEVPAIFARLDGALPEDDELEILEVKMSTKAPEGAGSSPS